MASLKPPLTIISNSKSGCSNIQFQPPAATWFDEESKSFVTLEARPTKLSLPGHSHHRTSSTEDLRGSFISGVGSIDSSVLIGGGSSAANTTYGDDANINNEHPFEIVKYKAFSLPKQNEERGGSISDLVDPEEEEKATIESVFDAAKKKKAAQETLQSLTTDISVSFPLPLQLATIENHHQPSVMSEGSEEDTYISAQTQQTVALSRRIPILAKFSPKMNNGMRFIALQYTPTMVRIAIVEKDIIKTSAGSKQPAKARRKSFQDISSPFDGGDSEDFHFTIDLSYDAYPITSKPERLPKHGLEWGSARNLFSGPKTEEGIVSGTTTIIGGGILWCARSSPEDQEEEKTNTELDLILVTTTSVIVYNINVTKKKMMKMTKTQIFPHPMAASFWYESQSSTLVIGSYTSNVRHMSSMNEGLDVSVTIDRTFSSESEDHYKNGGGSVSAFPTAVMEMKTLFFSKDKPTIDALPSFVVGTLREVEDDHDLSLQTFDSTTSKSLKNSSAVVLPTQISLVNLYGDVYCVEIGSLGSRGGIGLTRLDRKAGIYVRHQELEALKGHNSDVEESLSVGVLDNMICIFSKKDETTYFLDVKSSFSDDKRIFRDMISLFEPNTSGDHPHIHDEGLSFLAYCYFLDTQGQGLLYEVTLSLPQLLKTVPANECIIPFILRRNNAKAIIRSSIMERFSKLIESKDLATLRNWIAVIVDHYAECDIAIDFDIEGVIKTEEMVEMVEETHLHSHQTSLLTKVSLLALDEISNADDIVMGNMEQPPETCSHVLTQAEIMQMVLLPHIKAAIQKRDNKLLNFISSLSIHYFVELERRSLMPSVVLQCLVIALLCRTGQDTELSAFISAQQTQWTITRRRLQLGIPSANQMYFGNQGAIQFAETLFQIAVECHDKGTARQLISYATTILLGSGATTSAAKCLLSAGELNDAINICSKKIKPNSEEKIVEGITSKDFFRAAITNAKKERSISERSKSFYHLYYFLRQWDPSAFDIKKENVKVSRLHSGRNSFSALVQQVDQMETMVLEQSALAHDCPRFPDELFDGPCCQKLRIMYGYNTSTIRSN